VNIFQATCVYQENRSSTPQSTGAVSWCRFDYDNDLKKLKKVLAFSVAVLYTKTRAEDMALHSYRKMA
jgi:hypothetical protein